ncbi:MAG: hypothetical protein ACI4F9_00870 [Lachnospiraceae bacterium]
MKKIKGIKKAIGEYKRYMGENGYLYGRRAYFFLDLCTGNVWVKLYNNNMIYPVYEENEIVCISVPDDMERETMQTLRKKATTVLEAYESRHLHLVGEGTGNFEFI